MSRTRATLVAALVPLVLAGCSAASESAERSRPASSASGTSDGVTSAPPSPRPSSSSTPSTAPSPSEQVDAASDGRPRRAALTIPAIGLRDLVVVPYEGSPDDAPGTAIQDGGVAASPHGPAGGTGPGGIGNYIVTAHRTSSTKAFEDLPALRVGQEVHVEAGGTRFTYRISRTRSTSFRSAQSLARQAAAVPGHPGREPTQAMITLSTCATPEDHAEGNYWSDEFGNPEHRIDKVGVLVGSRPV